MFDLGRKLTSRIGGTVATCHRPASPDELVDLVRHLRARREPFRLLGGGSNIIALDGSLEITLIATTEARTVRQLSETRFHVDAGVNLTGLGRQTASLGLTGLECCCGIPGTVGAAVRINAGGKFGEVGRLVRVVTYLDDEGQVVRHHTTPDDFGYRTSRFLEGAIILSCEVELTPDDPVACRARIREVVQHKKSTQPVRVPSAGCVFRNPAGVDAEGRRLSAGRLIDEAGVKGLRIGGAMVSPVHANYFVNVDGASSQDFLALIEVVRRRVQDHAGVHLELEVDVWD